MQGYCRQPRELAVSLLELKSTLICRSFLPAQMTSEEALLPEWLALSLSLSRVSE